MAQWMQEHFKEPVAAPRPKPKAGMSGWLATLALLTLAVAVVGSVVAAVYLSRPAPEAVPQVVQASTRDRQAPPAAVAQVAKGAAPASPPAEVTAAPIEAPAKPATAPKALSTLIHHIDEHRDSRADNLRWLDACQEKRVVEQAKAAVDASRDDAAKWTAQSRLKQLLDQVEQHQREVVRLDDLCDTSEARLVKACADAGYPVPKVANPQTTWDNTPAREKKRPDLHVTPSATQMPRRGQQASMPD